MSHLFCVRFLFLMFLKFSALTFVISLFMSFVVPPALSMTIVSLTLFFIASSYTC